MVFAIKLEWEETVVLIFNKGPVQVICHHVVERLRDLPEEFTFLYLMLNDTLVKVSRKDTPYNVHDRYVEQRIAEGKDVEYDG